MKNAEREFLHELSSPLAALSLQLECMLSEVKSGAPLAPDERAARVSKCLQLATRIGNLIESRRAILRKEPAA